MIQAQTPTLAKIKNSTSELELRALLYIAICEVCDFFNVGKNMSDTQIALTADLIIETYWYMKLEEIKYCFRRAMKREKLFDRIDGNIILGWLKEYDTERTEQAIRASDQQLTQQHNQPTADPRARTYQSYINSLWNLAMYADPRAVQILSALHDTPPPRMRLTTTQQQHQNEFAFQLFRQQYIQNKKK
ncbi:MAG: hypothetical protein HDR82_09575 [Bacteroides sp.]|nr:hypothetical protein [Bacteroides sp.]